MFRILNHKKTKGSLIRYAGSVDRNLDWFHADRLRTLGDCSMFTLNCQ